MSCPKPFTKHAQVILWWHAVLGLFLIGGMLAQLKAS